MVLYKCPRCGKSFDKIGNTKNHIKRKIMCEPILSNMNIKQIDISCFKIDEESTVDSSEAARNNNQERLVKKLEESLSKINEMLETLKTNKS